MQAREDARLAGAAFAAQPAAGAAAAAQLLLPVPGREAVLVLVGGAAGAYLRLGEALLALPGHPDRDVAGAAQVSLRAHCAVGERTGILSWVADRVLCEPHAKTALQCLRWRSYACVAGAHINLAHVEKQHICTQTRSGHMQPCLQN